MNRLLGYVLALTMAPVALSCDDQPDERARSCVEPTANMVPTHTDDWVEQVDDWQEVAPRAVRICFDSNEGEVCPGTGVRVSHRLVLTADHVLDDAGETLWIDFNEVFDNGGVLTSRAEARIVERHPELDAAVLAVEQPPPGLVAQVAVGDIERQAAYACHYPEGGPMACSAGVVAADGPQPCIFTHTLDTRGGSSGGGLLDDEERVVALHLGRRDPRSVGGCNRAVSMTCLTEASGLVRGLLPCVDQDGDGWFAGEGCIDAWDCDDGRSDAYPAAVEVFDGLDQDCDGRIDEGSFRRACERAEQVWRPEEGSACDPDADRRGMCAMRPDRLVCLAVDGDVIVECVSGWTPRENDDCSGDDLDCDGHEHDRNDRDGDGFGDCPDADGEARFDCRPGDAAAHPGAEEVANEHDDDCDGSIDEGTVEFVRAPQSFLEVAANPEGFDGRLDTVACSGDGVVVGFEGQRVVWDGPAVSGEQTMDLRPLCRRLAVHHRRRPPDMGQPVPAMPHGGEAQSVGELLDIDDLRDVLSARDLAPASPPSRDVVRCDTAGHVLVGLTWSRVWRVGPPRRIVEQVDAICKDPATIDRLSLLDVPDAPERDVRPPEVVRIECPPGHFVVELGAGGGETVEVDRLDDPFGVPDVDRLSLRCARMVPSPLPCEGEQCSDTP